MTGPIVPRVPPPETGPKYSPDNPFAAQSAPVAPRYSPDNPFAQESSDREREAGQLRVSTGRAVHGNAGLMAEAFVLSQRVGMPVQTVARRIDEVRKLAGDRTFEPGEFQRMHPVTASWLTDEANATVSNDDWDNLGTMERLVGRWQRVRGVNLSLPGLGVPLPAFANTRRGLLEAEYDNAAIGMEIGRLYSNSNPAERQTSEWQARLAALERQQVELPARRVGEAAFRATAAILPSILGGLAQRLDSGLQVATYAGAAAAVAGQAGPQVALPEEVVTVPLAAGTGFTVGAAFGTWRSTMETEGGLAIQQFSQLTDANGQPIDPAIADAAGRAVGFASGAVEVVSLGFLTKMMANRVFKPVADFWVRRTVAKALAAPTVRRAITEGLKVEAETMGAEMGQEVLQQGFSLAGEQLARSASNVADGTAFEGIPLERVAHELSATAIETALGTFLLGLPGATTSTAVGLARVQEARTAQERLTMLGETAEASKLRARAPEVFRDLIERDIAANGAVKDVFIPVDRLQALFQEEGISPAEFMQRAHQDPAAFDAAARLQGSDVVIPLAAYVTYVAPTEAHQKLLPDLKFRPGALSAREAAAEAKAIEKDAEAIRDEMAEVAEQGTKDEAGQRVIDDITAKLTATGVYTADQVATMAPTIAAPYIVLAGRAKRDAWELYAERNIAVLGPEQAEPVFDALRAVQRAERKGIQGEQMATLRARLDALAVGRKTLRQVLAEEEDRAQRTGEAVDDKGKFVRALKSVTDDSLVVEYIALRDQQVVEEGQVVSYLETPETMDALELAGGRHDEDAESIVPKATRRAMSRQAKAVERRARTLARVERELARRGIQNADQYALERDLVGDASFDLEQLSGDAHFQWFGERRTPPSEAETELKAALASQKETIEKAKEILLRHGRVTEEELRNVQLLEQAAFHGSRHKFDQMTTEKIGTGEGAQIRGWGLYLAESPAVGRRYMRVGQSTDISVFRTPDQIAQAAMAISGDDPVKAAAYLDGELERKVAAQEKYAPDSTDLKKENKLREILYGAAKRLIAEGKVPPTGYFYELDVADAAVATMIDADAPLAGQSAVDAVLRKYGVRDRKEMTGQDGYNGLVRKFYAVDRRTEKDGLDEINGMVEETSGIKGIAQRLEEYQRGDREDQRAILRDLVAAREKFTAKEWIDAMYAATLYPEKAASLVFLQEGVHGVRFKDAFSRFGQNDDGTRNLVVFDENDVTITHRNGEPVTKQEKIDFLEQAQGGEVAPEAEPRLLALHNLSADNLLFAEKMGGLAVPSIGVVKEGGSFDGMGEITLIGRSHLADPAKVPTFDADAYSPTFPDAEYPKAKTAVAQKVVNAFRPWAERFEEQNVRDELWDNAVNRPDPGSTIRQLRRSMAARAMFLHSQGIEVAPIMEAKPISASFVSQPAFQRFLETHGGLAQLSGHSYADEDYRRALAEATRAAIEEEIAEESRNPEFTPELAEDLRDARTRSYIDEDDGLAAFGRSMALARSVEALGKEQVDNAATDARLTEMLKGREVEFNAWVEKMVLGMHGEPFLRLDKKKVPFTLPNIVEAMTGLVRGREKTMTVGPGKARAMASTQFDSLQWMRNASYKIGTEEEVEAGKKKSEEALKAYHEAIVPLHSSGDTWDALDASMRAFARAGRTAGGLKSALQREGFRNVGADVLEVAKRARTAWLEAPVPYFEAKPQRAVDLGEFAGAVVPESASPKVIDILEGHGIRVVQYPNPNGSEEARGPAIAALSAELQAAGQDVLFQPGGEKRPNAFIIPGVRQVTIGLMETANLSSVLHEFAHDYTNLLGTLAEAEGADPSIVADWQTILKETGATSLATMTREGHEKIARGFEFYLESGQAPTQKLARAFTRFKAWMTQVYRTMRGMLLPISPELRGVFDRMLASEEEIAQRTAENGGEPLFTTAEEGGMTDEEFAAYRQVAEDRTALAGAALLKRMLEERKKDTTAEWKARREAIAEAITLQVENEPVERVVTYLRGQEKVEGVESARLSKALLVDRYGDDITKTLPRGTFAVDGTADPEDMAVTFGFDSGDAMITQLQAYEPREAKIERLTDEAMKREFPDLVGDSPALADAAQQALHRAPTDEVLVEELRLLGRSDASIPAPNLKAVKQLAEQTIGEMPVRDVQPHRYQLAEAKAAKNAYAAMRKGDPRMAALFKRQQLLNHILWREARKAVEAAERTLAFASRMQTRGMREKLGKAGAVYRDAMESLLEQYEFARVSFRKLDRRERIKAWIAHQEAQGLGVSVAAEITEGAARDAEQTNYRSLTVNELAAVDDAMRMVHHTAVRKDKMLREKEKRDFEAVRDATVAEMVTHRQPVARQYNPDPNILERAGATADLIHGFHLPPEMLFRILDGDVPNGPVQRAMFEPVAEAQHEEGRMLGEAATKLQAIFDEIPAQRRKDYFDTKQRIPGIPIRLKGSAIFSMALNWGNAGNREALVSSTVDGRNVWTPGQIEAALKTLTAAEWRAVQKIWDLLDSYYPLIAELERASVGVAPKRVEATPFLVKSADGEVLSMKGGYYPLAFDGRYNWQAWASEQVALKAAAEGQPISTYSRAQTAHGHTIERVGSGGRPVKLELSVLPRHLMNVIHDLTHRRALYDVQRLALDAKVRAAIEQTAGVGAYRSLAPWLRRIGGEQIVPDNPFEAFITRARTGTTVVNMGLKVTTAMLQPIGLTMSIDLIGPKWVGVGLHEYIKNPLALTRLVSSMSAEMRTRGKNIDRDIRDAAVSRGQLSQRDSAWFYFVTLADQSVSVPTWWGAYRQAMAQSGDQEAAIRAADSAVRLSQSAGAAKDLSQGQGGTPLWRMFNLFYTFGKALYGMFYRSHRNVKEGRWGKGRFLASMFWIWFLPAAAETLLPGRGPDDDDDQLEWWTWHFALWPAQALLGIRDLARALGPDAFEYKLTPVEDVFTKTVEAAGAVGAQATDLLDGSDDEEMTRGEFKAFIEAVGYWGHLPSRQMWITSEYLYDWMQGTEAPQNPLEAAGGLAFPR